MQQPQASDEKYLLNFSRPNTDQHSHPSESFFALKKNKKKYKQRSMHISRPIFPSLSQALGTFLLSLFVPSPPALILEVIWTLYPSYCQQTIMTGRAGMNEGKESATKLLEEKDFKTNTSQRNLVPSGLR